MVYDTDFVSEINFYDKMVRKKTQVILSTLCPLLWNSTLAQDKPYREKPLIRDCFNHKGKCTLFSNMNEIYKPSQPWSAPRVLYEFLRDN